jgi:hypothetical protein
VESPFEGTLVIDGEKIYIRYAYGNVNVAEVQARPIREAVGNDLLMYIEGVNFVILPLYLNPKDHVALVTVPDNIFESCPSAEE